MPLVASGRASSCPVWNESPLEGLQLEIDVPGSVAEGPGRMANTAYFNSTGRQHQQLGSRRLISQASVIIVTNCVFFRP